ncbi:hypothetical protein ACQRBN_06655 [Bariatricus sp. SGI.154]
MKIAVIALIAFILGEIAGVIIVSLAAVAKESDEIREREAEERGK